MDVGDREQVLEDPFEPDVLAVVRGGVQLQQRLEGRVWMSRRWGIAIPCSSLLNEICFSSVRHRIHSRADERAPSPLREGFREAGVEGPTDQIV